MISRNRLVASMADKTEWTPDGHAIWTASVDSDGYPRVYVGRAENGRSLLRNAGRIHYEIEYGVTLAPDVELRNTCGNRLCLSHLEPVERGEAGLAAAHAATAARMAESDSYPCGHPRTEENTNRRVNGERAGCRTCRLEYQTRYNRERRRHDHRNTTNQ